MPKKSRWLQAFIEFLIENLTILLTIGYAGYIVFRQEIAKAALETDELLTAILAVLALLATSEIIERYRRLNSIEKSVNRSLSFLESRFMERPPATAFFTKHPSLDAYVQGASEIDLMGVTLTSTVNKQFGNLRERLQAGARVRVLLADPDSQALQMSAERSTNAVDADYYRVRLDATLRELAVLYRSCQEMGSLDPQAIRPGRLEVRLLSYSPSFGVISCNAHQDNGVAFVEIYPHRFGYKSPPTFDLTAQRDGAWYKYFIEQFDEMWNAAKEWQPATIKNNRSGDK